MCSQAISICIPFSSLEGTTDACTLKRILYMLFGRVGACDESSGASEKKLQVLSAYEVPTYPQRQSRRRQGSGASCGVPIYPIGSPGADKSPERAALGSLGPIGMSDIRWPIGCSTYRLSRSRQGSGAGCVGRFRADRAVGHPLADRQQYLSAVEEPTRLRRGLRRWPIGSTQPIEEEKGAKFLRRNNQIYIKNYFICIF